MREQSGRTLIEVIGVLVIACMMSVSAIGIYNSIRNSQKRTIAAAELEQIAQNTKLLMKIRGDYSGLSVDYLIKAGALKNNDAPIGDKNWSVTPSTDGKSFSITINELTSGECDFFATKKISWASKIMVNGIEQTPESDNCFSSRTNQISFLVE